MKESSEKIIKPANLIKFRKNKTEFVLCDCGNEILVIEYDEEFQLADIAIFQTKTSFEASKSWYQKLRYCYNVLMGNDTFKDQMVLTKDQLVQIKNFIESVV